MPVSNIFTVPVNRPNQDDQGRDPIAHQMDELQRISVDERDKKLGNDWFKEVQELYEVGNPKEQLSFRPRVVIPQLQVLMLNEATDLTDTDPRTIITKRGDNSRDRDREDAFMAQWQNGGWSNQVMLAELWALFSCIGYLQIGYDRNACNGQGQVWIKHRDPATVFPDPAAKSDDEWSYVIIEDRLYLDEVRRRWPERGWMVKSRPQAVSSGPSEESPYSFRMPAGPMSFVPGLPTATHLEGDGRVRVRTLWCLDPSLVEDKSVEGGRRPAYPYGRMVVECEGVILYDGENPTPCLDGKAVFPLVSVVAMPRLGSYYPPSATKYSWTMQKMAEKLYTQLYENIVRTNNLITVVNDQSGISIDNFGGLPAEVHVASFQGGDPIKQYGPPQLPGQAFQLPQLLLEMQRAVQGFTPARQGEPTQGNVSGGLYDMSIVQSQKLTRLRGRLMAETLQRVSRIAFAMMAKFYLVNRYYPIFADDANSETKLAEWQPIADVKGGDYTAYDVALDPGSVRPVSGAMLRMMVPMLKQMGLITNETALEMLEVPDAKNEAAKVQQETALAALAQATKGRK